MDDRELIQRLDACRADSDDARDPELASLAEALAARPQGRALSARVQQIDRAIGAAMEDVPLPAGLHERLLARLAEAQPATLPATTPIETLAAEAPSAAPPETSRPAISRRAWLWSALAVASAASVAGVALFPRWWSGQPELTAAGVQESAIAFYNAEQPEPGRDPEQSAPKLPLSRSIVGFERYTWRRLERFLNRPGLNGVAFDLSHRAGTAATLYVVPQQNVSLPSAPPLRPNSTTMGCAVAAWNEGSLTYVLVVKGGERAYQGFVRRTTIT